MTEILQPKTTELLAAIFEQAAQKADRLRLVADNKHQPSRDVTLVAGSELPQMIHHDPQDLVIEASANTSIQALQDCAALAGQGLALEVADPENKTLGAVLATRREGFISSSLGLIRDQVLGLRVIAASGKNLAFGGKVVKNVSGYDLNKLLIGSEGRLGMIVSATLRLWPLPQETRTLVFKILKLKHALELAAQLRMDIAGVSGLVISKNLPGESASDAYALAIRLDANPPSMAARCEAVASIIGLTTNLPGENLAEPDYWQALMDAHWCRPNLLRLQLRPSHFERVSSVIAASDNQALFDVANSRIDCSWGNHELPAELKNFLSDELRQGLMQVELPSFLASHPLRMHFDNLGKSTAHRALETAIERLFDPKGILSQAPLSSAAEWEARDG